MAEAPDAEPYEYDPVSCWLSASFACVFQLMPHKSKDFLSQYADNPELRECVNALSARDAILEPGIAKTFEQLVNSTKGFRLHYAYYIIQTTEHRLHAP